MPKLMLVLVCFALIAPLSAHVEPTTVFAATDYSLDAVTRIVPNRSDKCATLLVVFDEPPEASEFTAAVYLQSRKSSGGWSYVGCDAARGFGAYRSNLAGSRNESIRDANYSLKKGSVAQFFLPMDAMIVPESDITWEPSPSRRGTATIRFEICVFQSQGGTGPIERWTRKSAEKDIYMFRGSRLITETVRSVYGDTSILKKIDMHR